MDSLAIAQMNGAYQNYASQNMAYSSAIGQGAVYGGGYTGGGQTDQRVGFGMSHAAAIGAPLAAGAAGLMGLDPLSMGFRAGMGAYGMGGGIGGGLMAGAGVMLPMMAGAAAVGYAGNQMYSGAQQQLGLNNNLRSNFSFRNQYGGQGFTRTDMSQIGATVREMTSQFGPGGEIANFGELSGLAGKMGGMGLAQGVRDVKEFSTRFKEMVTSLKTMAKDLGTTLEGAMEFAAAAKGSGVFGMRGAQGFASLARQTAVSGGLAMSEVTGAASIGSQISRSIGGLGKQGAMAGIRTIGQIGTAQQMGVLSEEDVYNVTGLNGAEGRQAYAASSMQRAGSWLQSGRGRRLVASLAGKNGELDEEGVEQLLSGGMNIGQTISRGEGMKRNVGRANFIRNEGRLRGASLGRIGGFLPALQMMEWVQGKGITVDDLDDSSMLFMQRQLGMGRDEADQAVKMVQNMPQILHKQQQDKENDVYFERIAQEKKSQGIEGMQQRFDQAKEHVNGHLQKMGQDVFNDATEMVDRYLNKLAGTYVHVATDRADNAVRNLISGGKAAHAEFNSLLGGGWFGASGTSGLQAMGAERFRAGGGTGALDLNRILGGQSLASKYEQAGYGVLEEYTAPGARGTRVRIDSDARTQAFLKTARETAAGAQSLDPSIVLSDEMKGVINDMYTGGLAGTHGKDRVDQLRKRLDKEAKSGNGEAASLLQRIDSAGPAGRASAVSSIEDRVGINKDIRFGNMSALPETNLLAGNFTTEGAKHEAYATAIFGDNQRSSRGSEGVLLAGTAVGGIAGSLLPGIGTLVGGAIGGWAAGVGTALGKYVKGRGRAERRDAAGAYLSGEEASSNVYALFGEDEKERVRVKSQLHNELQGLQKDGKEKEGRAQGIASLLMARAYEEVGGETATDAAIQRISDTLGISTESGSITRDDLRRAHKGVMDTDTIKRQELGREEARRLNTRAGGQLVSNARAGLTDSLFAGKGVGGVLDLSKTSQDYLESSLAVTSFGATMGGSPEDWAKLSSLEEKEGKALGSLTPDEMRAMAKKFAGSPVASSLLASAGAIDRITKSTKKRGVGTASTEALGLSLTDEEKKLFGVGGKGALNMEGLASLASQRLGSGSSGLTEDIASFMSKLKEGKFSEASLGLSGIMGLKEVKDARAQHSLEDAAAKDPLQAAIRDNGTETNRLLDVLVASNEKAQTYLADVAKRTAEKSTNGGSWVGNPENNSGTVAPQPVGTNSVLAH